MPRKRQDVDDALLRKGFQQREGDHHYFIYYTSTGKKTRVFTKTSHSHREIGDHLLSAMAKQCKLTKSDFGRLIDCPLSRNAYEALLVAADIVAI